MKQPNQQKNTPQKAPSVLPALEEAVLKMWAENNTFEKSIAVRADAKPFIFYDGPPYATGIPHIGTLLASTLKDVVPRYKTMRGFLVERRFGWDCHGLPIEVMVEKKLGLNSRKDIEALGVEKFNTICKETVLTYVAEWQKVVTRTGRWVDFANDYKTMDPTFMESALWVFKKLYEDGLVYEDYRCSLYCTRCETPLSKMETGQDSYQNVNDPSLVVGFAVNEQENTYLLAWTTTPWTLSANVALAINPDVEYVSVKISTHGVWQNRRVVLAKERLAEALVGYEYEDLQNVDQDELLSWTYAPIQKFIEPVGGHAYRVVAADFVTTDDGTGVVHIAPAFGEADFELAKQHELPVILTIDDSGCFLPDILPYAGRHVKEADAHVIVDLTAAEKVLSSGTVNHSYPFCWRCKSALIYKAQQSIFVRVSAVKEQMITSNAQINWVPDYMKDGRFGKGIASAPDWNVSRKRYWGIPVPIWNCNRCERKKVVGSLEEIEQLSGSRPADLHRPFIDQVSWACQCGGVFERVTDVFDVWFDSGCVPYGQVHYPFANKEKFEATFPADFIAEGLDQTRGWFYTLHVLANALFEKPAFKNVIVNGLVMAEDGTKMSKSKGNMPDSMSILNQYGADALRLYLLDSGVTHAEPVNFSETDLEETLKKTLLPLLNVYSFFSLYAPADQKINFGGSTQVLDKWVLARLEKLRAEVEVALDRYELWLAVKPLTEFVTDLSTWYVRRSRDRFKGEDEADKNAAIATLFTVLVDLVKIMAPLTPFIAEHIYQQLRPLMEAPKDSVHLEDWPVAVPARENESLITSTIIAQKIIEVGHAVRALHKIKVRQPLAKMWVRGAEVPHEWLSVVLEELNIKELGTGEPVGELVDVASEQGVKVIYDVALTAELKREGLKRELVRTINNLRKNEGFTIADRATLVYTTDSEAVREMIALEAGALLRETLSDSITEGEAETEVKINEFLVRLSITKS